MDFIDYREKLGIGFCDEEKFIYFKTKILNLLNTSIEGIDSGEYFSFCNLTGEHLKYNLIEDYDKSEGFGECVSILRQRNTLNEFLAYYIALTNSISLETNRLQLTRDGFSNVVCRMLREAHIPFDLLENNDEYFIFPKGAKELDEALVSQPLEWLKGYPQAHKTFCIALKQYADGEYIRDTPDNLRKALEEFLQEFLGNEKNLETNKKEICKYLGAQNVDAGVCGLFQPLINAYKNINDRGAKHNDKVDEKLLEFLLYQTGVLIRMVLSVKENEKDK